MATWLDNVKKELAKRQAVGYYSGGPDSYLERQRGSILSSMDAGGVGTADAEERRREARMAQAPKFFPAYELQDETSQLSWPNQGLITTADYDRAPNDPIINPTTGDPLRSKPKFVVGQLSGPRLTEYIGQTYDKLAENDPDGFGPIRLRQRSRGLNLHPSVDGKWYNWLADPIKRLAEGQVLLVNNAQQNHPSGTNHLAVVKENGLVTQRLINDKEMASYQNALRSGLPVSLLEQLQDDYNSSPSQKGRDVWDRVFAAAPEGTLTANQMTLYPPDGMTGGYVNPMSPSDIYVNYKYRSDPFVMAHESGHMIANGDDGTWDQTFRDALAADAQMQADNPNQFGNYNHNFRYDFTPGLTTVSEYGATDPSEAWGDLYGYYAEEQATNQPAFYRDKQTMRFADMYPQTNKWIRNLANLQLDYWPRSAIQ